VFTRGQVGVVVFWLMVVLAVCVFARTVWLRYRYMRLGRDENRFDNIGERFKSFILLVFGQTRVARDPFPGIIHILIFWGFIVVSFGTLTFIGEGVSEGFRLPILGTVLLPYFLLFLDIFGVLVILAVLAAAYRRYVIRPDRLDPTWDAAVILALIFGLMVTDFLADGIRIAVTNDPTAHWSPVCSWVASLVSGTGLAGPAAPTVHAALWWAHVSMLLGFLIVIPMSKHLHLLACPLNELFHWLGPKGRIPKMDLEDEELESFGVNEITGFTWKQLLDLWACTECGRCQDNCPAYLSGKPLSPKKLIKNLRLHLLERGPALLAAKAGRTDGEPEPVPIIGNVVTEEELWSCTTCYACQEHCAVFIEHMQKNIDMRRYLVLTEGRVPPEARSVMKGIETQGNPWGMSRSSRADWADGLDVKILEKGERADEILWVGCAASFDERGKGIARSFVRALNAAGITPTVLGTLEKCCGDPARRLGNEYLYQMTAEENVELLESAGVKRIVTPCPHCFNTFKAEYPEFGADFEVLHHSIVLADLISSGRLSLSNGEPLTVTYHDSCYLARYNGITAEPRSVIRSVPGLSLAEMQRREAKGFCCGGGGGRMWMEENVGRRMNEMRIEEAAGTNAHVVGTACPFCMTMLDDAVKAKDLEGSVEVLDLAQIVERALAAEGDEAAC